MDPFGPTVGVGEIRIHLVVYSNSVGTGHITDGGMHVVPNS